jgi:hypothetical protein
MIKPIWLPIFLSIFGLALSPPLARSSEVKITAKFRIDPTGVPQASSPLAPDSLALKRGGKTMITHTACW